MIKSNILKEVPYPSEFCEEEKLEYDRLYAEAKIIHADVERENPFIIHFSIVMHIRAKRPGSEGFEEIISNEELEQIKESYKLKSTVIECKEDENHYIYDQSHNPIYWPATVTISSDEAKEGTPSVVVQS
jgi:hypothetical protein